MTRRRRQSGFTLMEVLVASVLIATVFVAVVSVMSQSLRNLDRMRPHELAIAHAKQLMNDQLLREQLTAEHTTGQWSDGYRWQVDIAPELSAKPGSTQPGSAQPGQAQPGSTPPQAGYALFDIHVLVVWGDRAQPKSYSLATTQWAQFPPQNARVNQ